MLDRQTSSMVSTTQWVRSGTGFARRATGRLTAWTATSSDQAARSVCCWRVW